MQLFVPLYSGPGGRNRQGWLPSPQVCPDNEMTAKEPSSQEEEEDAADKGKEGWRAGRGRETLLGETLCL